MSKAGFDRGAFYRACRMLHAYLSAVAFLALILFSVTGVLLNHPEWMWSSAGAEEVAQVQLSPAELAAAQAAGDPGKALAATVAAKTSLTGAFSSGDIYDGQALIRMQGPKGASEIAVDMTSGRAEVKQTRASLLTLMGELHRGLNSGHAWRLIIDATGVVVALFSVIGYILFFSLRFRLRSSLILTGASLVGMAAVIVWLVP